MGLLIWQRGQPVLPPNGRFSLVESFELSSVLRVGEWSQRARLILDDRSVAAILARGRPNKPADKQSRPERDSECASIERAHFEPPRCERDRKSTRLNSS